MPEMRTTRRLAAVLAADVVGYSRLMSSDEAGTLSALKRHREQVFNPAVSAHTGRIVKLIGDGTLVEFASVVDAVDCGLAIQRAMAAEAVAEPAIILRIGINLGDIIIDGDDIYGDGVNVAARLEPLAEPGGICVSAIVNESIGSRVEVAFTDAGEVTVKNIERPIRVWKWHPGSGAARPATPAVSAVPKRETPSIAVLPFNNMSGDPEQEYFSDGISEDIITDLSKLAGLLVIARNSSFAYKGKAVDLRFVGRELGVTSVLEGSIRRAGNRVRITAQLIDATNGAHIWADRYDRDLNDIFAVQDDVTKRIVDALKVTLTPNEKALLLSGGTTSAEAHDCVLRARALLLSSERSVQRFERCVTLLERAVELDPGYSDAYSALSMTYSLDFHNNWSGTSPQSMVKAKAFADKAVEVNPNEPFGHYVSSVAYTFARDLDRAGEETEKALALSPSYALAINSRGVVNIYRGEAEKAIPDIQKAMRLDPEFGQQYLHFLGVAHFLLGRYETAALHFRERILMVAETDLSRAFLASALGHLGRPDEARAVWHDLKRVNPRYSFDDHMSRLPFRRTADTDLIRAGLAHAGLPD